LSAYLAACFVLAAIAASSLGGVYLTWPRRLSAEEWVLHRRLAAVDLASRHRPGMRVPGLRVGRLPDPTARLRAALGIARSDLNLIALFGSPTTRTEDELAQRLLRLGAIGAVGGAVAGLAVWLAGRDQVPYVFVLLTLGSAVLVPALDWLRLRRAADRYRALVKRRLPRLLTGSRMLLESGSATPQHALSMAVAVYNDPAADVLREALRGKEVGRTELEESLDQVAHEYGLEPLHRLADAFRIGSRYGTQMGNLLTDFALELRRGWHAEYRERISRAPVLMTLPAMVFFVLPLLALILLLVFTPLMKTLSEL
jgi:Type II secretion system (T2SS), protein F